MRQGNLWKTSRLGIVVSSEILIEPSADGITLITLNRPNKLNALNLEMIHKLIEVAENSKQEQIKVVILTGAGRAFSSGGDITRLFDLTEQSLRAYLYSYAKLAAAIDQSSAVWIAALNGLTYGGGFEISVMCDLRIAEEDVNFCVADIEVGALPTGGLSWRLPRLVGSTSASWMTLANPVVTASRAFEIGLISEVVPPGSVVIKAYEMANRLICFNHEAVIATRQAIRSAWSNSMDQAEEYEVENSLRLLMKSEIIQNLKSRFAKEQ